MFRKFLSFRNLFLAFIFVAFCLKAFISLDPDFAWRLRTGQIIYEVGIPNTDPYSYTMPSFRWVDHAWLSDLIIYLVFLYTGKTGLAFLFSFIGLSAIVISEKIFAVKKWNFKHLESPTFIIAVAVFLPF